MAQAKRDENSVPTLLGVSNVDGVTPVVIWADPITHRLLVDVVGSGVPGGSTGDVQFNDSGSLGGQSNFTFDKTTGTLTVYDLRITNSQTAPSTALNQAAAGSNTVDLTDVPSKADVEAKLESIIEILNTLGFTV